MRTLWYFLKKNKIFFLFFAHESIKKWPQKLFFLKPRLPKMIQNKKFSWPICSLICGRWPILSHTYFTFSMYKDNTKLYTIHQKLLKPTHSNKLENCTYSGSTYTLCYAMFCIWQKISPEKLEPVISYACPCICIKRLLAKNN